MEIGILYYQVVCQFFLRGQCKFGTSCRNEYPADARQTGFGSCVVFVSRLLAVKILYIYLHVHGAGPQRVVV